MDHDQPMLDLAAVRRRLHISDTTARRLIKDGELTAYKVGGRLRFKAEEIQAYIDGSRVVAAAQ